jgi:PAS domain-containing protein
LTDLAGQSHFVRELFGSKLTVVLFFSAGESRLSRLAAQNLLADIQQEIAQPFASDGLKVLAIHVGEASPAVTEAVQAAGITFPVLVDRNRAYFALVARQYLPRIYLVNQEGKILWLDLGFTELTGRTREQLLQAVQAALAIQVPVSTS